MSPNSGTHFGDLFSVLFIVFLLDFDLILILTFTMYAWYSFELVAIPTTLQYFMHNRNHPLHPMQLKITTTQVAQYDLYNTISQRRSLTQAHHAECSEAVIRQKSSIRQNKAIYGRIIKNSTEHQCNIRSSHNTAQWSSCHT